MIKRINKYINLSLALSLIFMLTGFILIVWTKASLDVFAYIIGFTMVVYGVYNFIDSFGINPVLCLFQMSVSILTFLLGFTILSNPSIFESILPVMLGILFIISGAFKTRVSLIFRGSNSEYMLSIISSILIIVCGIILIVNPLSMSIVITKVIGIMLTVYSVLDIIDMVVFKKKIKDIDKYINSFIK